MLERFNQLLQSHKNIILSEFSRIFHDDLLQFTPIIMSRIDIDLDTTISPFHWTAMDEAVVVSDGPVVVGWTVHHLYELVMIAAATSFVLTVLLIEAQRYYSSAEPEDIDNKGRRRIKGIVLQQAERDRAAFLRWHFILSVSLVLHALLLVGPETFQGTTHSTHNGSVDPTQHSSIDFIGMRALHLLGIDKMALLNAMFVVLNSF